MNASAFGNAKTENNYLQTRVKKIHRGTPSHPVNKF